MKYIYQSIYILIVICNLLLADIPETLSYQGYLSENGIAVSDGDYNITFRLYSVESGGSAVWTEEHLGLSTIDGVFSTILGESVDLPDGFSQQYWLSIEYDDSEMSPRIQLASVPYSMASKTSETTSAVVGTNNVFSSDGYVGIGTTDPVSTLDVRGSSVVTTPDGLQVISLHRNIVNGEYHGRVWINDSDGVPKVTLYGDPSANNQLEVVGNASIGQLEVVGNASIDGNISLSGSLIDKNFNTAILSSYTSQHDSYFDGIYFNNNIATNGYFSFIGRGIWNNNADTTETVWLRGDYTDYYNNYLYLSPNIGDHAGSLEESIQAYPALLLGHGSGNLFWFGNADMSFTTETQENLEALSNVYMVLDGAGRLGIGNEDPQHTLDVTGDINFTGNIFKDGNPFGTESNIFSNVSSAEEGVYSQGVFYDRNLAGRKTLYTYPEFAINHYA
ncbi:MAG: hypothetical protein QF380_07310, partial [Candidatus Marinimicrobia bacterium]|nr:hypothetical protein [Candidatus Neomarinimicrobiota bacterium]